LANRALDYYNANNYPGGKIEKKINQGVKISTYMAFEQL